MRKQNVARIRVQLLCSQKRTGRLVVGRDFRVIQHSRIRHKFWKHEGHQPEIHFLVAIRDRNMHEFLLQLPGDIDLAAAEQFIHMGKADVRVMVPRDHENILIPPGKFSQKMPEQLHRLRGWYPAVIDVPRHHHGFRLIPVHRFQEFLYPCRLVVLHHLHIVKHLPEMQVRYVKKLHDLLLCFISFSCITPLHQRTMSGQRSESFRAPTMYMAPVNSSRSFST